MPKKYRRVPQSATIIGKNLKALRRAHNYSQPEIAKVLGVSFQQIQKYEKGQNRLPLEKFFKLKALYDVPYDVFFTGMEEAQKKARPDKDFAYLCFLEIKACKDRAFQEKIYKAVSTLLG